MRHSASLTFCSRADRRFAPRSWRSTPIRICVTHPIVAIKETRKKMSNTQIVRLLRIAFRKHIALAAHRQDDVGLDRIIPKFVTQPRHVHIHRPGFRTGVDAPHVLE